MKPILEIKSISKKFLIQHQHVPYLSFREKISNIFTPDSVREEFWALKDISLQIEAGESIGFIGRNGAGKSTLLKILSRITPPSTGKIVARGRIASLLEVGTGFHQELTGRENIFMNGSILGMKHAEIKSRFDEIVEFSGVEQFLDTPLKHYSSGMQLRLAFAVAAHLEPEILIIDEVLAVGDAEFQKKCMGKMEDVRAHGRTILFVSHNMDAIETLCKKSVFLSNGQMVDQGDSSEIITRYISNIGGITFKPVDLTPGIVLQEWTFSNYNPSIGTALDFRMKFERLAGTPWNPADLCILFYNYKKQRVAIYDLRPHFDSFQHSGMETVVEGHIENFNLIEGSYYVGLYYGFGVGSKDVYDLVKIQVKPNMGDQKVKPYDAQYRGFVELR